MNSLVYTECVIFSPELVPRHLTVQVFAAQLVELLVVLGKVFEPEVLVLVVLVGPDLELGVGDQGQVGGQHHQVPLLVLELGGPHPLLALVRLLLRPLLLEHEPEVLVAQGRLGAGPGAPEPAAVSVATAHGVGT